MRRMIGMIMLLFSMVVMGLAQSVEIKGIVKEAKNGEALEFANIILQTTDSVFISGITTDERGRFSLNQIQPGNYLLAVSSMGYESQYFTLNGLNRTITLEDILLEDSSMALEGVTVTASNQTSRSDKKIVFPTDRQIEASTNGLNLLQQLMLPKLQINPLFNEIALPGGGEIQLRINGVKVELQEILALQPAEIIRIEYHDNPGLRYGNAEVVLDYIVHRPETGGSFGVDLSDSPIIAWGNNFVHGKVNHKKSEFSMNYGISHRDFYKIYRNNEESFLFEDGSTLQRKEDGEHSRARMNWQHLNATYSFNQPDKMLFNATVRYYNNNQPHFDYKGNLYNIKDPADRVYMVDNSAEEWHRPALDLYYQQSLPNDQTIVINAVGTYNYTNSERFYQESRDNVLLTDINNLVTGKKYSIIGEGIYEKKLGSNRLSGGIRYTHSFSDNEYKNGHNYITKMDQSETFLYAEFTGKAKKLDYTLGVGMTRSWFGQENVDGYQYYTFNPRIVLQYNIMQGSSIRLNANISNSAPSLSNLSAVEQVIDSLQIQRGNPNLNPYLRYRTELTYELQKGMFYGNLWGTYEYQPKAIMDEKFLENGKIIQTWDNQKDWQRLASRLTVRVGPWKEILQVSLTGGVNHYMSHGNSYSHTYTNWFSNISMSATYKKFMLAMGMETNWNWFYGETMNGGENIHYAMLRYSHKNLAFTVGAFNPFVNNYKMETENWSKYASYKRALHTDEISRMLLLQFSYNFSFGRTFKGGSKRINNSDDDSGVMSSGK